jgi:branched-subunit amino acid transport protein
VEVVDKYWPAVLVASLAVYSWKLLGFILPAKIAKNEAVVVFANKLTIALLAALFAVQTLAAGHVVVLDSRFPAVAVAGLLYWRKAPFLVAVLAAAIVAAMLRLLFGWQ